MISSELKPDQFTRLVCLIGHPIGNSPSPIMHNEAFRASGFNATYLAFDVPTSSLKRAVSGMKALNVLGFNVTIPHKVSVIELLDGVDQQVKDVRAVNTVVNRRGTLKGYNTDVAGVIAAFNGNGVSVKGKTALILGAGGAARACLAALITKGCKRFYILNRTPRRARSITKEFNRRYGVECAAKKLTTAEMLETCKSSDVIVNATPLGAYPRFEESLVPKECLRQDHIVFDVVYKPIKTKLIEDASEVGATIITGLDMLIEQGAAAYKLWTGKDPPTQIMRRAVESVLS